MKTVDLKNFNNDWYNPGNKVKILLWFIVGRIFLNTYLPIPVSLKLTILRLFGGKIGKGIMIKPKVNIKYPWFLEIKDYVWIGEKVWIDNFVQVTLESNVCISQEAMLLTGNHNYRKTSFDLMPAEIYIKQGAWIGAKTVVCPGVTVGENAILTVGSIATKDMETAGIYQGNPAILIKKRIIE
jgi:putative colanic acid biosynthesis acetyltransferase WcaF